MGIELDNLSAEEMCDLMCGAPEEPIPMKYIIMCGGDYPDWETPRQLCKIHNETIVERTIRLLKEEGVEDICISSNDERFKSCGVPVVTHSNFYTYSNQKTKGSWLNAFYPTDEPTCYIFGDVVFSPAAIHKIVHTDTDDIEFFASAPPFAEGYPKKWAEPFAFKVFNTARFKLFVSQAKELLAQGMLKRGIAWELWQVIKRTNLNKIDYTNYTVINDYTCDIDEPSDILKLNIEED